MAQAQRINLHRKLTLTFANSQLILTAHLWKEFSYERVPTFPKLRENKLSEANDRANEPEFFILGVDINVYAPRAACSPPQPP